MSYYEMRWSGNGNEHWTIGRRTMQETLSMQVDFSLRLCSLMLLCMCNELKSKTIERFRWQRFCAIDCRSPKYVHTFGSSPRRWSAIDIKRFPNSCISSITILVIRSHWFAKDEKERERKGDWERKKEVNNVCRTAGVAFALHNITDSSCRRCCSLATFGSTSENDSNVYSVTSKCGCAIFAQPCKWIMDDNDYVRRDFSIVKLHATSNSRVSKNMCERVRWHDGRACNSWQRFAGCILK